MKRFSMICSLATCLAVFCVVGCGDNAGAPSGDEVQNYIDANPEQTAAAMAAFDSGESASVTSENEQTP